MKYRFLVGILFLAAAAALIAAYLIWGGPSQGPSVSNVLPATAVMTVPPVTPVTTVSGYIGGSKANLLEDPDVQNILREKYQLQVKVINKLGGLEQVCGIAPGYDFLWPGTELSVEEYKSCGRTLVGSDSLLLSPVIFYSWEPVTEVLNKKGLIEKGTDGIYSVDMERFAPVLLDGKTMWKDVGWNRIDNLAVSISDPTKSNSGQVFMAMLGRLRQKQMASSFDDTFPDIKKYSENLGFKPDSTTTLFTRCLGLREGGCPIFAAYESLLPDFVHAYGLQCQKLKGLQAIYPNPTIWATHPFIAATPNGKELLAALKDDKIQQIAVEKHGFRSILGETQPQSCIQTAVSVNSMPLPTKKEMDDLQKFLTTPSPKPSATP